MRHIDNPSSANILPGDCIVATPTQRAALSIGPEDAGKVIVEKSTGRMYLATMTEGAKPLSTNLSAELAAIGVYSNSTTTVVGGQGFGVGICPETLPADMAGMAGFTDKASVNFGNYIHSSGSVMVFVPAFWYKWGTGANGLAINACAIAWDTVAKRNELAAQGYALHRAFWDGGVIKSGFFVDKYLCSASAQGVAVSVRNGNALSSGVAHTPFADLVGAPANAYYGAIDAAKTRGPKFFCSSRFIFSALAMLSYAHAQASSTTTWCAWYDATNNFPKGCNNSALRDAQDASVLYASDGYLSCGQTGSGDPFEKTTHNGQACGVADLNGLMWEINLGLTSDGSSYFAVKPSVAMSGLTSGNSGATDAWGAAGRAANYDNLGATYGAATASSTIKTYGNAAQVFSEQTSGISWAATCLGIPLAGGVGGANAFGNDVFYDYRLNDMCALSGGHWINGSSAGVWALNIYYARGISNVYVGFRAAIYPTT